MDLGKNWARQALSNMLALSKVGFWANNLPSWHYPRVDLGQKLAKLTYLRVDLVQNLAKWALSSMLALFKGGLEPKVVNPRNYRHVQRWIWGHDSKEP